jgi:hypothetical protein
MKGSPSPVFTGVRVSQWMSELELAGWVGFDRRPYLRRGEYGREINGSYRVSLWGEGIKRRQRQQQGTSTAHVAYWC